MGAPEIFDYLELRPYLCAFCAEHAIGSAAAVRPLQARALGCTPSHAYNIILGFTRAPPADVAPTARFLELDPDDRLDEELPALWEATVVTLLPRLEQ